MTPVFRWMLALIFSARFSDSDVGKSCVRQAREVNERNDRMRSPIAAKALVRRIGHALSNPRGLFFPGNVMPRRNVASEGWKEVNSGSVSGPTHEWLRGQNPTLASFGGCTLFRTSPRPISRTPGTPPTIPSAGVGIFDSTRGFPKPCGVPERPEVLQQPYGSWLGSALMMGSASLPTGPHCTSKARTGMACLWKPCAGSAGDRHQGLVEWSTSPTAMDSQLTTFSTRSRGM